MLFTQLMIGIKEIFKVTVNISTRRNRIIKLTILETLSTTTNIMSEILMFNRRGSYMSIRLKKKIGVTSIIMCSNNTHDNIT